METIEHAYQTWLQDRSEETVILDKLEFDFIHMKLKKQKDWVFFHTFAATDNLIFVLCSCLLILYCFRTLY